MTGSGVPFEVWSRGEWDRREVAGETFHEADIRRLFPGGLTENGSTLNLTAHLVPEPHNPHDPNAVAVQVQGGTVGYLPREDAVGYSPVLQALVSTGLRPCAPCEVWATEYTGTVWDDEGSLRDRTVMRARVTVTMGEPHLCVPSNQPPRHPHVLLPYGDAVQIGGEKDHMDAIAPFLCDAGECFAYATLHALTEQLSKSTREVVEVRLDGRRVGQLTPKMSEHYLPVIEHLGITGTQTAAKVLVKGNRLKAEVVVYAQRAHQLPANWPDGAGPQQPAPVPAESPAAPAPTVHAPVPPKPSQICFNPAPGWPPAPDGWEPFPGWEPDPSWPAAPGGWHYWVGA